MILTFVHEVWVSILVTQLFSPLPLKVSSSFAQRQFSTTAFQILLLIPTLERWNGRMWHMVYSQIHTSPNFPWEQLIVNLPGASKRKLFILFRELVRAMYPGEIPRKKPTAV